MSDPVLDRFSDLASGEVKDYPGKRKPALRQIKRHRTVEESPSWDASPVFYIVNGKRQEFFTIRHLAAALGYSQQSIRAWENSGLLARSPYRSPKPRTPTIGGRNTKGKRLWTRAQIEGILKIAKEEGVILNKQPPTRKFARRVSAFFKTLTF
jgi:hypothetical protein